MTFGDWIDTEEKFYNIFGKTHNSYYSWYTGDYPVMCNNGEIIPNIYPNTVIHNGDIYDSDNDFGGQFQ